MIIVGNVKILFAVALSLDLNSGHFCLRILIWIADTDELVLTKIVLCVVLLLVCWNYCSCSVLRYCYWSLIVFSSIITYVIMKGLNKRSNLKNTLRVISRLYSVPSCFELVLFGCTRLHFITFICTSF